MRIILLLLLCLVLARPAARADEPPTFNGKTVEGWLQVLQDPTKSSKDRSLAIGCLSAFGPKARAAVPLLLEEFHHEQGQGPRELWAKFGVVSALARISHRSKELVPFLIDQINTEEEFSGQMVVVRGPLVRIGSSAVPALIELLNGDRKGGRRNAAIILGEIGAPSLAAAPSLIEAIKRSENDPTEFEFLRSSVVALGQIGFMAREQAIPCLNSLTGTNVNDVELEVVMALDKLGAPPIERLLKELREGDGDGSLLAELGPRAHAATPALLDLLGDERIDVRTSAACALARIDALNEAPIPVLIDALKHRDDKDNGWVAYNATEALALYRTRASVALPFLISLPDEMLDEDAFRAMVALDPEGKVCLPRLITALRNSEYDGDTSIIALCIGLFGPRASEAVPALIDVVKKKALEQDVFVKGDNAQARIRACRALGRIGPAAKAAVPALIGIVENRIANAAAENDDFEAEEAVIQALGSLGPDAKAAVPVLVKLLENRHKLGRGGGFYLCRAAVLALSEMGDDAKAAVPVLHDILTDNWSFAKRRLIL